jgi:hypothetical protein
MFRLMRLKHSISCFKQEKLQSRKKLFYYVLSAYGTNEFSTKQLEKDYKDAADATIRSFVLKLAGKEVLTAQQYGNRTRYKLK